MFSVSFHEKVNLITLVLARRLDYLAAKAHIERFASKRLAADRLPRADRPAGRCTRCSRAGSSSRNTDRQPHLSSGCLRQKDNCPWIYYGCIWWWGDMVLRLLFRHHRHKLGR